MTTPMPTIFDVNVQPEEGDYFEPTAADYEGDDDYAICAYCGEPIDYCMGGHNDMVAYNPDIDNDCIDCGRPIPNNSLSGLCNGCDTIRYLEEERQFEYGFNVLYYLEQDI